MHRGPGAPCPPPAPCRTASRPTCGCRAFPPQWAKAGPGRLWQPGRSCPPWWLRVKPGLHLLSALRSGVPLNFPEQHRSVSPHDGRTTQAHSPRHSGTQRLGLKMPMPLAASATQADILCAIFVPFAADSGLVLPPNTGSLSLKLQTSEFQTATGPQCHQGLWFRPTCTRVAMGIKCDNA